MIPDSLLCTPAVPFTSGVRLYDDPLVAELIATTTFKRLRSIHFLGGIDYLCVPFPNGLKGNIRHTRYQHSLGVAQLALNYAQICNLPSTDRQYVCTAALLHDLGHAPLSHSLEPVFSEFFGIEHHQATENILTGRAPLGRDVYSILRKYKMDIERLIALIAGQDTNYDGFFSGPINFDTIEGIIRTFEYARLHANISQPSVVVEASLFRYNETHLDTVDAFWRCKDFVYKHIIHSQNGILADYICQTSMRNQIDRLNKDDFYATEDQIFRKLPELREMLTSRMFPLNLLTAGPKSIPYVARRFFVDPDGEFFSRDDRSRYRQLRHACTVTLQNTNPIHSRENMKRDLFDDPINKTSKKTL